MKRFIALILCLLVLVASLTGCSAKYQFKEAFFPLSISVPDSPKNEVTSYDIDSESAQRIQDLFHSVMNFVNTKFELNLNTPCPAIREFEPEKESIAASYFEGTIYINSNNDTPTPTFSIVHEIIHALSDKNGDVGFCHTTKYDGVQQFIGYGLTEGLTDVIAFMYCNEYNYSTPQGSFYGYMNNDSIAEAYYMLEPQVVNWLFESDHESMSNFVKKSIKKVATIPNGYNQIFDFHFYIYQDVLMNYSVGNNINDFAGYKCFMGSFEMLCVSVRACDDSDLSEAIYNDIISNHDTNEYLKEIIFG